MNNQTSQTPPLLEVIIMYAAVFDRRFPGPSGGTATGERPGHEAAPSNRPKPIPLPRHAVDNHDRDLTQALEHRPQAAGTARHLAQVTLQNWRTDTEATDAAVLIVSELVTNAVEHAQAPIALHLHREPTGSRIWIGVTDGGPAPHQGPWTSSCSDDEHGRGLTIVTMLADTHGTHPHPDGRTTHWARLTAA
ncbi:ATP-binding protein [Streptomyces sp. NBC_00289]|uniref:ATP-binding protein n=1 Tax=Streptomyces sp. NBC_00289 TaxID=2975703 RepID=UPI003243E45A